MSFIRFDSKWGPEKKDMSKIVRKSKLKRAKVYNEQKLH